MRTLSSTLLAAQKATSGTAIIKVVFSGTGQSTKTYTTGDTVNRIISITEHEQPYAQRAAIVLSNADGEFTALNLMGYKCVISLGYTTSGGDEYSPLPPMFVTEQRLISSGRTLNCSFKVIGIPTLLALDRASDNNILLSTDATTVKQLIEDIAGDTGATHMAVFNHTKKWDVAFDQEDSLIDDYNPADGFRVYINSSRLAALRRLLDYTKCAMRVEDDGDLHVIIPTVSTSTQWAASTAYALNDTIVPTSSNGVEYICTVAGTSDSSEPTFPTEVGETVADNDITWTVGYDYDYRLDVATYHSFFQQGEHNALVIPNLIVVESNPGDSTQYSGTASDSGSITALEYGLGTNNGEIRQYLQTRLASNAEAGNIATALLSKYQLNAQTGSIRVPMNVGAEVYDFVKITDSRINQNHVGNVSTLTRWYIQERGTWMMRMTFGGWKTARDIVSDIQVNTDAVLTDDNVYPKNMPSSSLEQAEYYAGDTLFFSNDDEVTSFTSYYVKYKEIYVPFGGEFRLKFDIQENGGHYMYGRIYRNGVAAGTERKTQNSAYVTFSEDLTGWSAGDLLQLYCKIDGGSIHGKMRNFRVYCTAGGLEFQNTQTT